MSDQPRRATDSVNILGVAVIGAASAFLIWATAVALQGYYAGSAGELEDDRRTELLTDERRAIEAIQDDNLHRAEENAGYKGAAERCFRNPIENAMKMVVSSAATRNVSLVPAVGAHDRRTVAPIPGYPDPAGTILPPPIKEEPPP